MSAWSSESPTTRQVGQWVGCEDDDGLIVVHPERETCAVCQQASPVSTSAESPANTPVEPAGASEPPSEHRLEPIEKSDADRVEPMRRRVAVLLDSLYGLHVRPGHVDTVMSALSFTPTAAPEPCVWRDIASAPKDGTPIRSQVDE